ncbi:2-hydroxyacid dehydrogenase [Streptomyces sp. RPA4-5]|uniref:2-hydroxyacid dehydrogenase n=1 Tax=Streptomyces TaxID=1883 RepID=UPI00143EC0E9|nr:MULTISPECIES: 2-hydroxyacid dehydrogenase [Streptomyces]MCX4636021.1 2-hydroxyacid dehydrogenase [Streptomyces platensis]QIY57728.1 2-hydroxyacid dehydrogenase [Streptomyces sp. RPA4-5]WJY40849.1 2-hydroxyacid dehydrogenase [Streptomyces sp. P9-2B-2]
MATADQHTGAHDVWLPIPPDEIEGLPDGLHYVHWDAGPEYPADPARCVFYAVPYMKSAEILLRPLPLMSRVRVVQTLTAGTENMLPGLSDMPSGARLCNARGLHDASTAELALTLTLAALRGIPGFVRAQDAGEWRPDLRPALADKSVLIVGYGSIGSAIEDRLTPFECARVVRIARTARDTVRGPVHPLSDLSAHLPEADVVVLATPLTDATRGLVGSRFLAQMKDGALLVNVARGGVVDTKALLAELESGRLYAALDVTDPEPLPTGHPLWHAPGVLITPHVGGPSSAFLPRAKRLIRDQLTLFAAGEPLRNVVATAD